MKKILIVVCLMIASMTGIMAQDIKMEEYRDSLVLPKELENATMPYYILTKGEMPVDGYPLYVYIHGSGEKNREWANGLHFGKIFDDAPSIYVIPQIPDERRYRWYQKSKQWAFETMLREMLSSGKVNPNKVFLIGISEGGYGSQRLASFYADYLAGAGPMAGGEPLQNAPAENCANIAFSFLTGAKDFGFFRNELTAIAKEAFDSLEKAHPGYYVHRIELIPDAGHRINYSLTTKYLKNFKRNPLPDYFYWEDMEVDGRHRPGFYNMEVVNSPAGEEERTCYEYSLSKNTVKLSVKNVRYSVRDSKRGIPMHFDKTFSDSISGGRIRLYFNENMIDLSKKVSVYLNGKKVFSGKLKSSSEVEKYADSLWFDPARKFTSRVEISF